MALQGVTGPSPWERERAAGWTQLRNEMAIKGRPNMLEPGGLGAIPGAFPGLRGLPVWQAPCLEALARFSLSLLFDEALALTFSRRPGEWSGPKTG